MIEPNLRYYRITWDYSHTGLLVQTPHSVVELRGVPFGVNNGVYGTELGMFFVVALHGGLWDMCTLKYLLWFEMP